MLFSITKMSQHFLDLSCRFIRPFLRSPGISPIVLSAAIYGLTIVLTKGALTSIPPITLLAVQTASSTGFFWLLVWQKRIPLPSKAMIWQIGTPGLLEPGLSYLFGTFGLSLTTASNATFISTMEPVVTIALAWLFFRERASKLLIGSGVMACIGVSLVATPESVTGEQFSWLGNGLLLLCVLTAAVYAVFTGRSAKQVPVVLLAAIQQSFALLFFLILLVGMKGLNLETIHWTTETYKNLLVTLLSGAFGYGAAFLLYLKALHYQSVGRISIYLTLIPIFGVLAAYIFLGERLLLSQGLGGFLVLSATVSISRTPD